MIACDAKHILHPVRQSSLSGCRVLTGVITETSVSYSTFKLASLFHGSEPIATLTSL